MATKNTSVRLRSLYSEEVVPALIKEYGYTSVMQTPKLEKVVINIGVGDATKNSKLLEESVKEIRFTNKLKEQHILFNSDGQEIRKTVKVTEAGRL